MTRRIVWAERIKPMSLNPGSVPILASDLGMFSKEGVELEVMECLGSPGAVSALRSGVASFAQLPSLEGARLVGEVRWPGRIFWVNRAEKTSSTAGFVMMSSSSVKNVGDLRGKRFGVGADGDYWEPIIAKMLRVHGLRRDEIVWVKDLDPAQKADMLLEGKIDVMLTSIQTYIGKLEGKPGIRVLARGDDLNKYRDAKPGPSFVGLASEDVLGDRETMRGVTVALIKAARLFSDRRDAWVDAASKRRPDVPRDKIVKLWDFFRGDWPVNGGVDDPALAAVLKGFSLPAERLTAPEFERRALGELGFRPR